MNQGEATATMNDTVKLKPIHPGRSLGEKIMRTFGLNASKLATALRVTAPNVYSIVNEHGGISPEMALRLGRFSERLLNSGSIFRRTTNLLF